MMYQFTTPQKNIWNMQSFYGGTSISNICGAVMFDVKYDRCLLEKALNEEIRLQDGMRLRFRTVGGKTVQYIAGYSREEFDFMEFDSLEDLKAYGGKYAVKPFELPDSKLYRFTLFEIRGRSGVLVCASHLISDAWTFSILARDVLHIYNLLSEGKDVRMQEYSYADFIESEREYLESEKYERDRKFWTEKYIGGIEASPVRLMRTAASSPAAKRYEETLSAEFTDEINGFCSENGISQTVLFEAAASAYLFGVNPGNRSVTIGVPVLNRNNVREKNTAGMFVSTVPLTITASGNDPVLSLCGIISECHKQIFRHQKFPYADILRIMRAKTDFSGNPYDITVSFQNGKISGAASAEWFFNGFAEVPLMLHIDSRCGSEYTLTIDYRTEVFPQEAEISLISERIKFIVRQIISGKNTPLKDISLLPEEEYRKVVFDFNNTAADYPKSKCVHELFSERARETPDRTVLIFGKDTFSYRQLDEISNAIARFLRNKGVKPNEAVPIISWRSWHIIAAMLGILKAGGAYMPISPEYPEERIKYMLEAAGARLAVTWGFSCGYIETVPMEGFDFSCGTESIGNVNKPDDICYVIFTSGSSGKPKGAAVSHKNVVNYCSDNRFNVCRKITGNSVGSIVSVTNFVFDIFVTESILPLLNGIKIYLADDPQVLSQKKISLLTAGSGIEMIQTTPTKMRSYMLDKSDLKYLSYLKKIVLGGEELPADLYTELKRYTSAEIYNIYGPAETTVWSAFGRVTSTDITIGGPIANTRIYILDSLGKPLPVGIAGEMCISGDGVGKGYMNRPGLTAERFVPDPFFKGETMYRTGDLARFRADGEIEFLGRIDSQIKIRGMRIEPGEIESAMSGFGGIGLAAVTDGRDGSGRQYLAGYYTSEKKTDEKALRAYLASKLPVYMIPNYFTRLDKMPVTASGKTDRKKLPPPDTGERVTEYAAPETERQKRLCDILSELLGVRRVGVNDDFFVLGGDSLKAIEYASAAQNAGIDISLRDVFEYRTVSEICSHITDEKSGEPLPYRISDYPKPRSESDIRLFRLFVNFTKHFYDFQVTGLENLDRTERYILCPNHESDLDCMWVWAALDGFADLNDTCALIAREHLNRAVPRRVLSIAGGIPIERKGDFVPSMKRALEEISGEKRILLVHPEGTRTRNGSLGVFRKGAAVLSKKSGVCLVPVCINGAREIFPPDKKLPRIIKFGGAGKYRLQVRFGVPIKPLEKSTEQLTDELCRRIEDMKTEDKR